MTGWCAPYVPGWDTHGLPIESAVLKDKKVKRDEMTTAQFRTKCREYAESYIEKMTGQFQRLGVLGEWENPYITLLPEFEAKQIEVFGKMAEKGLKMCIRDRFLPFTASGSSSIPTARWISAICCCFSSMCPCPWP